MATTATEDRAHHRRRFSGRDPAEPHRASTPLELLYDLTIVVAFGAAANEMAHFVAEDHVSAGAFGFVFACFAVTWAWLSGACAWTWYALLGASVTGLSALAFSAWRPRRSRV